MNRRLPTIGVLTLVLALAACDEMAEQPKDEVYGASPLFDDGAAMRHPPVGTVAREDAAWESALAERPPMTLALLARGRERYEIFCAVCHDPTGHGQGVVPSRGFPHPPSFHSERLRAVPSRYIVEVITDGYGVMYSYADRVPPTDRWAIAAYVRALQLSQAAPIETLSPADVAALEAQEANHGE